MKDPVDGLPLSKAGEWAEEKHRLLADYIVASGPARARWGPSTYLDLHSGPGRQLLEDSADIINGSPLIAWTSSKISRAPFAQVLISDRERYAKACKTRLEKLGAPVEIAALKATEAAHVAQSKMAPDGLHIVFADPYGLRDLPWRAFEPLLGFAHIDFVAHFSQSDLTRNLDTYFAEDSEILEAFAPGWRKHVGEMRDPVHMRGRFFEHWINLFAAHKFKVADFVPLITSGTEAPLYRLVCLSRHPLSGKIWKSLNKAPQRELFS